MDVRGGTGISCEGAPALHVNQQSDPVLAQRRLLFGTANWDAESAARRISEESLRLTVGAATVLISELYQRFNPANVDRLASILSTHQGVEQGLIDALAFKYSVLDPNSFLVNSGPIAPGKRRDLTKVRLKRDLDTYAQLQLSAPPLKIDDLAKAWAHRDGAVLGTISNEFLLPPPTSDLPLIEREWMFWQALSHVGVFVCELYLGTPDAGLTNAQAGKDSSGQCVVNSGFGTFIMDIGTGKVFVPNGKPLIYERLRSCFPPVPKKRKRARQAPCRVRQGIRQFTVGKVTVGM